MRALAPVACLLFLAGCDTGTEESGRVAGTRAVQRSPVTLPEGTRPRGAARREAELAVPGPPVTAASEARGRDLYGAFCTPCHGAGGRGDGPITAKGFPRPPAFDDARYEKLDPARTVEVIMNGYGLMYPMADRVAPVDAWAVARHVDGLKRTP